MIPEIQFTLALCIDMKFQELKFLHVMKTTGCNNSSQNVELMLQETSTHPDGGSLVVFATVDVDAIQVTMSGEDPSYILLLPWALPSSQPPTLRQQQPAQAPAMAKAAQVTQMSLPMAASSPSACRC